MNSDYVSAKTFLKEKSLENVVFSRLWVVWVTGLANLALRRRIFVDENNLCAKQSNSASWRGSASISSVKKEIDSKSRLSLFGAGNRT